MNTLKFRREDIIRQTSEKLDLSHNDMKLVVDSALEIITKMLTENQSSIHTDCHNFGVLEVKAAKVKPGVRNPKTNEEIYVPFHRKVHFKAGKLIREVLQKEWIK